VYFCRAGTRRNTHPLSPTRECNERNKQCDHKLLIVGAAPPTALPRCQWPGWGEDGFGEIYAGDYGIHPMPIAVSKAVGMELQCFATAMPIKNRVTNGGA
jgi:hypothetical protein